VTLSQEPRLWTLNQRPCKQNCWNNQHKSLQVMNSSCSHLLRFDDSQFAHPNSLVGVRPSSNLYSAAKRKQCRFIVWRTLRWIRGRLKCPLFPPPLLLLSLSRKCVSHPWSCLSGAIELRTTEVFFWIQHFYYATSKLVLRGKGEPKKWLLLTRVASTKGLVPKEYGVGGVW